MDCGVECGALVRKLVIVPLCVPVDGWSASPLCDGRRSSFVVHVGNMGLGFKASR